MNKLVQVLTICLVTCTFAQPFDIAPDISLTFPDVPFAGEIILTQRYSEGIKGEDSLQIDLPTGKAKPVTLGENVWQHSDGVLVYRQRCGNEAHRYMLLSDDGEARALTPCSNTLERADSQYDFAKLSPDQSKIAVERFVYDDEEGYNYDILVFDSEKQLLATFENHTSPTWLPDGRLLVGGAGIYMIDADLQHSEPITLFNEDGDIFSGANNIALDSSATRIVFEHQDQIWHIDIEGHNFYQLVTGEDYNITLRFPAWSPDGQTVSYLARHYDNDAYFGALFFTNVKTGQSDAVSILEQLKGQIRGPLSWRSIP